MPGTTARSHAAAKLQQLRERGRRRKAEMQVLAETMVGLRERMQGKHLATLRSLVDQVTLGLDRFVDRSSADIDALDEAVLTGLVDEAEELETQWHDMEQLFDASTRRGEQVQRELVSALYRMRLVGLQHEIERLQQVAKESKHRDQQSNVRSLDRLGSDLSSVEAKIKVLEASDLDGWRGLRRGLQRGFQRLEKQVSAIGDKL
ncbi:MAG: hypothetical protein ACR2QJ_16485 [Geminicoccaceae bacterium]